jgi:hypothetical protein
VVVQKNSVLYSHGPKAGIGHVRPVNCWVQHHGPGNGHDRLDRSLGVSVVMMGSNTGKANDLAEDFQMGAESLWSKGRAIIRQVGLWNDSRVTAHGFEICLGPQSFVTV